MEHVAHRSAQHRQNGHGDHQTDDRVGQRDAQCDSAGGNKDGQGSEAVGTGVQAVGDQGG
ncbi:hypothetical protein NIIDMKKI_74050 [Mycobacterium kansasii]|uniref:Uncharacterized protein n=1 Tax=Mycobacterium kansasii TaxID=1768 RepID=A0A7G1IQM7_MYCKA|nr:hypothetical protein NIIDMKKI_74050 [Mycobacterium kansasii]